MTIVGAKPKARLRTNVAANFAGRASSMLLSVVFAPFYIHFLGIESFGLIGFYITLQGSIKFLEMGLSRACNRQLAFLSGQGVAGHEEMGNTLRTLEAVYWLVAIVIGVLFTVAAPFLATHWLNTSTFTHEEVEIAITIMGWVIALRWPVGLYTGAMMGMQAQVALNIAQVIFSLFVRIGAVLVLWLIQADVTHYFLWQMLATGIEVCLMVWLAWRFMPVSMMAAAYSWPLLKKLLRFSAGIGLNEVLAFILNQADKLILSAVLPLKQFGYYVLASMIVRIVPMLAYTANNAVFPRISQYVGAETDKSKISGLYHLSCQFVALLIMPVAAMMIMYSHELLMAYTGDRDIAQNTALILSILAISKVLHASMVIPYSLQLAYGWVRMSVIVNVVSVIWLVPATWYFAVQWQAEGAAMAWLVVAVGYVVFGISLMHKRLLPGESMRWYRDALLYPAAAVAAVALLLQLLSFPESAHRLIQFGYLGCIYVAFLIVTAASVPLIRKRLMDKFRLLLTR